MGQANPHHDQEVAQVVVAPPYRPQDLLGAETAAAARGADKSYIIYFIMNIYYIIYII